MLVIVAGKKPKPEHLWLEGAVQQAGNLAELHDQVVRVCQLLADALAAGDMFAKTEVYDAGSAIQGMCLCGAWPGQRHMGADCNRSGHAPGEFWGPWEAHGYDPQQPELIANDTHRLPWSVLAEVMASVNRCFALLVGGRMTIDVSTRPSGVRSAAKIFRRDLRRILGGQLAGPWDKEAA